MYKAAYALWRSHEVHELFLQHNRLTLRLGGHRGADFWWGWPLLSSPINRPWSELPLTALRTVLYTNMKNQYWHAILEHNERWNEDYSMAARPPQFAYIARYRTMKRWFLQWRFLPRDALVHSAVLRLHVVRLSVRLSVCNVGGSGSHRLEILETKCTVNQNNTFALRSPKAIHLIPGEHGEIWGD